MKSIIIQSAFVASLTSVSGVFILGLAVFEEERAEPDFFDVGLVLIPALDLFHSVLFWRRFIFAQPHHSEASSEVKKNSIEEVNHPLAYLPSSFFLFRLLGNLSP